MDYISVKEFAQKYGVSERTARNYCASGKIEGVVLVGKTWNIPADATLPMRKSKKQQVSPLLFYPLGTEGYEAERRHLSSYSNRLNL